MANRTAPESDRLVITIPLRDSEILRAIAHSEGRTVSNYVKKLLHDDLNEYLAEHSQEDVQLLVNDWKQYQEELKALKNASE